MTRLPALPVVLLALLQGCSSLGSRSTGIAEGRLHPCPAAPRCVGSTDPEPARRIEPLRLAAPGPDSWARLVDAVASRERTTVVVREDRYARAEVISPWRVYTDDLELLWDGAGQVDVRSSARLGYYDFGVNRERIESLRRDLQAAGIAAR